LLLHTGGNHATFAIATEGKNAVIASTQPINQTPLDELYINTIRTLAMDAVQQANSGHPGTPMALAPVAYYLWQLMAAIFTSMRTHQGP
jgi:hypothetical protein